MGIAALTGSGVPTREAALDLLVRWGDLSPRDRKRVDVEAHGSRTSADRLLVAKGLVRRFRLLEALAEVSGVPAFDLSAEKIKYGDAQLVPRDLAEKRGLLVVGRHEGRLLVGMVVPDDAFALQQVTMVTGLDAEARIVWEGDLEAATERVYSLKVERITAETPHHGAASPAPRNGGGTRFATASHPAAPDLRMSFSTVKKPMPQKVLTLGTVSPVPRPSVASVGPAAVLRDVCTVSPGGSRLRQLTEAARRLCGAEHAALWVSTPDGQGLELAERAGPGVAGDHPLVVPLDEHTLPGYTFVSRREFCTQCAQQDPRHSRDLDLRMDWEPRSAVCCPIVWEGQPLGVLQVVNRFEGPLEEAHAETVRCLAEQAALILTAERASAVLRGLLPAVVEGLRLQAADCGAMPRGHGELVARVAVAMGQEVKLGAAEIELLRFAGYLHDLGRAGGDAGHAARGADVLERTGLLRAAAPAVRHHHDWHDGQGGEGLRGDEIPPHARILAVAEAWVESLEELGTAGRIEALRRMSQGFGRRFHPSLRIPFDIAAANVTPER